MIHNHNELRIVCEQLMRAELALESLRDDVLPNNPRTYQVMAEPCLDMIASLRAQIDDYLGIAAMPDTADIVISLEGERVELGRTSAASITRVVDTFRRGLQSVVEILESVKKRDNSRRRPRWIESICDLPFVGMAPGSVKIMLGEPQAQNLFGDEEREAFHKALKLVFDGIAWADVEMDVLPDNPFNKLDNDAKQSLLGLLTRLLPPRSGDIERVGFRRRNPDSLEESRQLTLTRKSWARIRREMEALSTDTEFVELEGVIRSVDLDAQTFTLRERVGNQPDLPCEYAPDLEAAVKASLDCRVIVAGSLETSQKTNRPKLLADSIELMTEGAGAETGSIPY